MSWITRTNYFEVNDEKAFLEFMNNVYTNGEKVNIFKKKKDTRTLFGFGCYGCIDGYGEVNYDEQEETYEEFINELQKYIKDKDAAIIIEILHDKLRYVRGCITVVTNKKCRCQTTDEIAIKYARELLNDYSFDTEMSY